MKRYALTAALVFFCGATTVMAQETAAPSRPSSPAPASGPYSWAVGPFAYDPSGNVATIGGNYYVYDPMGRLGTASVQRPDQPGSQVITYGYDVYGNRTTVNSVATSVASLATNRLTSGGAIYDAAGNLVQWQPPGSALIRQYTYDSLDMITNEVTGGQAVANIYTADDERLWRYEVTKNVSHWTVRDAGGRVLREFVDDPADDNGAAWKLFREYIYRDGQLLAVNTSTDTEHYSLDHLGSPRLVTDGSRNKRFEHHYLPFGGEWTIGNDPVDGSRLRFTSHERDTDLADQPAGTLDYMHARYYSSSMGRFLSVDPVLDLKMAARNPQGWNRYSYVLNNPLRYVDPDGRQTEGADGSDPDDSGHGKFGSSGIVNVGRIDQIMMAALDKMNDFALNYMMVVAPIKAPPLAASRGAIGFAEGTAITALAANRLQHASRHLTAAGILGNWSKAVGEQFVRLATNILERPQATFDATLRGQAAVKGFAGSVNGKTVVVFVFKDGKDAGKIATSVVPTARQLEQWGLAAAR